MTDEDEFADPVDRIVAIMLTENVDEDEAIRLDTTPDTLSCVCDDERTVDSPRCPVHGLPGPALEVEFAGPTATAGEIITALSLLPPDRPVTILQPDGSWWFNLDGLTNLPTEPSAMLVVRNDFDTRQW